MKIFIFKIFVKLYTLESLLPLKLKNVICGKFRPMLLFFQIFLNIFFIRGRGIKIKERTNGPMVERIMEFGDEMQNSQFLVPFTIFGL